VVPVPLRVAAALAALEGVLVIAYAVVGVFALGSHRGAGVAAAVFFLAYGVALMVFARALTRLKAWARSPILLTQLIGVLVVWNFRVWLSIALAVGVSVAAVVVLVGLFHPASVRVLARDRA